MRPNDDLAKAFDEARLNYGTPALSFEDACEMLDDFELRLRLNNHEGFEEKMKFVLDVHMVYDVERRAYQSFLSRVVHQRRRIQEKERDAREFAPIDEDGYQY